MSKLHEYIKYLRKRVAEALATLVVSLAYGEEDYSHPFTRICELRHALQKQRTAEVMARADNETLRRALSKYER